MLKAMDLARSSFLLRRKAIQYSFQNSRFQTGMAI